MRPQYKRPYYYIHNVNKESNIPTDPFSIDDYNTWDNGMYDVSVCDTNENIKADVGNQGDGTDVANLDVEQGCPIYGDPEDPTRITGYTHTNTFAGGGPTDNENAEALKDIIKDQSNRKNAGTIRLNPAAGDFDTNPVEKIGKVRYGNASKVRLEIRYGKDNSLFELTNIWVDYIKSPQHIRLTQEQLDLTEDTSQKMEFPDYVCQEIINELVHIVMENSSDPRMQTHPAFS